VPGTTSGKSSPHTNPEVCSAAIEAVYFFFNARPQSEGEKNNTMILLTITQTLGPLAALVGLAIFVAWFYEAMRKKKI